MAGGTAEQQRAASYYLDPVLFAKRILGDDPWETQIEIAHALEKPNARIAVKGCHASSKTYGAAELVLWFITRFKDGIAVTTAPTNRQVEDIMWGEIHKAKARSKFPYPPGNLTELNLGTKAVPNFATGFTTDKSDQAAKMSGYHGPHVLFVLDEAPGIPPEILEAIEGAAAGGDVRVLMLGNPTIPGGPFHDAFTSNRETWRTFTIDAYQTPNFAKLRVMAAGELETISTLLRSLPEDHPAMCYQPRPYLATPLWARARLKEWGQNSPRWQSRVRGQFPQQAEDALISLLWLEQAEKREARPAGGRLWAGIDVAGPGEDETVCYVRDGAHLLGFGAWSSADPRGEVVAFLNPFKHRLETVNVDAIGVGYNFGLHLEDHGFPVELINVGESARDSEKNANSKAEYYWGLRERFECGDISGLVDETTISQLATIKYKHTSHGQVQIESKEDARKRGVKSPDRAEALMLAFADRSPFMLTYMRQKAEYQQAAETAAREGKPPLDEWSQGWNPEELSKAYEEIQQMMEGGSLNCPKCGKPLGATKTMDSDGKYYHPGCVRGW